MPFSLSFKPVLAAVVLLGIAQPLIAASGRSDARASSAVSLLAVHMITPSSGWAVSSGSVLRTSDGGAHWTVLRSFSHQGPSPTLGAIDDRHAWVLAYLPQQKATATPRSAVYATADGGRTWHVSAPVYGYPLSGLAVGSGINFIDALHGWLLTSEGAAMEHAAWDVYRTGDGGHTWQRLAYGNPYMGTPTRGGIPGCNCLNGISFRNRTDGWLAGGFSVAPNSIILYHSTNGGASWSARSLPMPRGHRPNNVTLTAPAFFGSVGLLPAHLSSPSTFVLYVTHDGLNWSPTTPLHDPDRNGQIPDAFALDPQHIWAWLGNTVYRSDTGGRQWNRVSSLRTHEAPELDFVNQSTGFALEAYPAKGSPRLWKTIDGGRTWRAVNPAA